MERTKVVLAQAESKSLRTTIPAGIARQFNIKEGSDLGWDIQARDNRLVIVVVPAPPEVEPATSLARDVPGRGEKGKGKKAGKGA
jgi:bifunctional DNA-binding transcriptional regulator/antitoxin component of YhaV-PrlF toxin-antitoxin module